MMNMTTCKSSWRTALGSAWLTLFVRHAFAVVAVAIALGAATTANAATNITWPTGKVGGSEANPWNIYDSSNWNGTTPSGDYNLNFSVSELTYLTNSATISTKIADCLQPISGDFVFLGDIYCHVFGDLNNGATGTKVSVVKKGDWKMKYSLWLARCANTEMAFTNETGSITVSGGEQQWMNVRIGDGNNSKTTIRNISGDWTINNTTDMILGGGSGSSVSITSSSGNWTVNGTEMLIGKGDDSSVFIEKDGGDWTIGHTIRLAQGSGAKAEFRHRGGSLTLTGGYGIQMGWDSTRCQSLFEISGGAVTNNIWSIGVPDAGKAGSESKFVVKGDGEYYSSGKGINLGFKSTGYLNIEDQGRVTVDHVTFCGDSGCGSDEDCYLNLSGGTLATKYIKYGSGSANATMTFNGGKLKATAAETLIQAHNNLAVTVGAGGGVIDNGDFDITIDENIGGTGGLIFTGGGTTTLSGAVDYSGKTAVTPGTTLDIANADAKSNILSHGLVLAGVPELNTPYAIFTYSSGGLTDGDLANVTCPIASAFTKTTDGTSITITVTAIKPAFWTGAAGDGDLSNPVNWMDNAVPGPGTNATIFCIAPTTLAKGAVFAPSSITFAEGCAAVTINGESGLADITAITNLSSVSHVINVPVVFADKIFVVQSAMSWDQRESASIRFAGGVSGTTFASGTARYLNGYFTLTTGESWTATDGGSTRWGLLADSSLTTPEATDTCELALGQTSSGGAFTAGVVRTSSRLLCWNYGEYVVTNELEVTLQNSVQYCGWDSISQGKFKFEKLMLSGGSGSNPIFKLGNANTSTTDTGTQQFYIGKGGLCFADGASQYLRFEAGGGQNNATVRIDPWHGDYTIDTKSASNPTDFTVSTTTYFGTTDENGDARTVTDNGIINSYGDAAQIHFDGKGTFVVNADCTATCPVTVHDSATLAINAGKKLTTGPLSLGAGTTLCVASADLPINVSSLALPESGKATIQITGDAALADGDYALFSTTSALPAGFDAKIDIVLPDGSSATRRLYTADNGKLNLVLGDGPLPFVWTGAADDGNKMNTPGNWLSGTVPPAGATVFIPATAGTLDNDIGGFAPASVTFGYGDGEVSITGGNAITGIAAITNLSSSSHAINVPVSFNGEILVVQGAMSWDQRERPSIRFAGGVTGTTFASGTARYLNGYFTLTTGESWTATDGGSTRWGLLADSSLTTPEATDTCELALGQTSSGGAFTAGVVRTSSRLLCWNYGEYVVTNELEVTLSDSVLHCGWDNISQGKFKFEKMTLNGEYDQPFKFGTDNSSTTDTGHQYFYIGEDGLCFGSDVNKSLRYETGGRQNNMTVHLNPWHGDYTIHKKDAADDEHDFYVSTVSYFGTTDENGNACTVTADAIFNSGSNGAMHIDGSGKFVVNAENKCSCAATVHDGATLAINAGKKVTTGEIAVNNGATLEVAQSGTVTLGEALTLHDGAALGFNWTERATAPVLDLTGKTVTFGEGKTIKVKVSTADGITKPKSGANVLTSGGGFTDVNVSLADGSPDWALGVSVNDDGNIVLNVKPNGVVILFM